MSSYYFSELAIRDLNEICDSIGEKNIDAASKLFDAIWQKCKLVASFPNMGKVYSWILPNLWGFIVDDYIVFYYSRKDGIYVVRVVSERRDLKALFEEFNDE